MALQTSIVEASDFLRAAVSPINRTDSSQELSSSRSEVKSLIMNAAEGLLMEVTKVSTCRQPSICAHNMVAALACKVS